MFTHRNLSFHQQLSSLSRELFSSARATPHAEMLTVALRQLYWPLQTQINSWIGMGICACFVFCVELPFSRKERRCHPGILLILSNILLSFYRLRTDDGSLLWCVGFLRAIASFHL